MVHLTSKCISRGGIIMTKIGMNQLNVSHLNQQQNQPINHPAQKEGVHNQNHKQGTGIKVDMAKKSQEASRQEAETSDSKASGNGRLRGFFSSVKERVISAGESVQHAAETVVSMGKEVAGAVKQTASNIASNVKETAVKVGEKAQQASESLEELKAAAAGMVKDATAIVSQGVGTAVSIGQDVVKTGANIAEGLRQIGGAFGKDQSLGQRVGHLSQGIQTMTTAFEPLSNISETFQTGKEEIGSRMDAIKGNYLIVREEASEIKSAAISIGQDIGQSVRYTADQLVQGAEAIGGAFTNHQPAAVYG